MDDAEPAPPRGSAHSGSLRLQLEASLGGAYAIERELRGGMSQVFVARDNRLDRRVVVKVLHPDRAAGISAARFEREIRLAARLQHPHIVPLLSAGDVHGLPYYTMPFIEGEALRERLVRDTRLSIADAVRILRDMAEGLAYAHEQGIVHRDLKPENVLLSRGHAMIADFGVAKAMALATEGGAASFDGTGAGVAIGTPAYMAPEQAVGDPAVDHRVDLYALGVVAYELLTGSTPFAASSPFDFVKAHLTAEPTPLRQRRPDVPEPVASLVMRLLAKRPQDRPQSAVEVIAELDRLAGGSVIPQRVSPPWKLVAAALAILVLGGAIVFGAVRGGARNAATMRADPTAITVAPFRVAGAESSLRYLREGMLDLLAAKLSGEGGVRAVDPRTVVSAWTRARGRSDIDLPLNDARAVAARVGSGQLILGTVIGTPARLTISADLIDVSDGATRAQATVHGSADSLTGLVDGLAARLLSLRAGEERQRLENLTSTSVPALQAYLEGAFLYRRGRYQEAAQRYVRALELDTTFALAAIGVVDATGWGADADGPRATRLAWQARERLSPRDRALLHWLAGPRYPAPSSAAERFDAAERFAQLAPDSPHAWYALGDAYYHLGDPLEIPNALDRSAGAFQRALQLDSSYAPALQHLPIIYFELGDTAVVRRAAQRFMEMSPGSETAQYLRWAAPVMLQDTTSLNRFRATFDTIPASSAWFITLTATELGIGLADASRAFELMDAKAINPASRQAVREEARSFHLNGGRPTVAALFPDIPGPERPWARSLPVLNAIFWDGDSAAARQALSELKSSGLLGERRQSRGNDLERMWAIFAVAQWELSGGELSAARRAILSLRDYRAPADSGWHGDLPRSFALILDAQIAAAEGRKDAGQLRIRLDSVARFIGTRVPGEYYTQAVANLVAARLWESSGDVRRAHAAVRRVGRGLKLAETPLFSTLLREQGRLALRLGDRQASVRAYRHYLALRENAEPRFAGESATIRASLRTEER